MHSPKQLSRGVGWMGALLALACQEPAPKRVQLELVELVLSTDPVAVLVWKWDETNARKRHAGPLSFSVEPADLASVSEQGQLVCKRSGDGVVSVAVNGVPASTGVKCRLVERIEAGNLGRIEIADGAVPLDVAVFDPAGERLSDVPLSITTRNAAVARGAGTKLEPLAIGRAKVTVKAGKVSKEVEVDVVRKLTPEALPMNGDTRINFSLEPGRYELVVELASEQELKAEWRGAPYCDYRKREKRHVITCALRSSGGVVFDNPAFLERGAKEISVAGVEIREIPED